MNTLIQCVTFSCHSLQVWHHVNRNCIWQCNTQQNSKFRNNKRNILCMFCIQCVSECTSNNICTMLCLCPGRWDYFTRNLQTHLPNHWWGLTFVVVSFFFILFTCVLSVRFHAIRMLLVTKLTIYMTLCPTSSLCQKASIHYWLEVSTTLPSLCMMWV